LHNQIKTRSGNQPICCIGGWPIASSPIASNYSNTCPNNSPNDLRPTKNLPYSLPSPIPEWSVFGGRGEEGKGREGGMTIPRLWPKATVY